MSDERRAGRDWGCASRERRGGVRGFVTAAPGGGGNRGILIAIAYFSFHLKVARSKCENSCTRGRTWYRNGTELVLAVLFAMRVERLSFLRGVIGPLSSACVLDLAVERTESVYVPRKNMTK